MPKINMEKSTCTTVSKKDMMSMNRSRSFDNVACAEECSAAMRRPKTHPELLLRRPSSTNALHSHSHSSSKKTKKKVLVSVTVGQSSGPLRALICEDATVQDVMKEVISLYSKEGRRPSLPSTTSSFTIHLSRFSFDCLDAQARIKDLGSRDFFMRLKDKDKPAASISSSSATQTVTDDCIAMACTNGSSVNRIPGSGAGICWYSKLVHCILVP